MGTHPIFESDFDCLTEMSDAGSEVDPNMAPHQDPVTAPITDGYMFSVVFLQKYGWYIIFGLIALSFVKKNLERHIQAFREWQEVAKIRQERIKAARENGGGKESMARWEEAKKKDNLTSMTGHTTRGATVTETSNKPKAKFNFRGEYNPMTGNGAGASKFKPNRAQPKRGG